MALTENGNIIAINLVTFINVNILKTNLPDNYKCSSLNLILQHLVLAIDGFAVIVYNCENLSQIDGLLALAPYKWQVECNQNGILTLLS